MTEPTHETGKDNILPVGTHVEWPGDGDIQYGMILHHVPLEDGSLAYHIASYHVVHPDEVKRTLEVEYAEPWKPVTE